MIDYIKSNLLFASEAKDKIKDIEIFYIDETYGKSNKEGIKVNIDNYIEIISKNKVKVHYLKVNISTIEKIEDYFSTKPKVI